jgi:hypothetical protein
MGHALMENRNGLIVGAVTTCASGHAERLAALALIEPHADRPHPVTLGADKGYDTSDFVMELRDKAVTPHVAQNQSGGRSAIASQPLSWPSRRPPRRACGCAGKPHSRDGGWCGHRAKCGIADFPRSIGNSLWRWPPTISSAYPNCSPSRRRDIALRVKSHLSRSFHPHCRRKYRVLNHRRPTGTPNPRSY